MHTPDAGRRIKIFARQLFSAAIVIRWRFFGRFFRFRSTLFGTAAISHVYGQVFCSDIIDWEFSFSVRCTPGIWRKKAGSNEKLHVLNFKFRTLEIRATVKVSLLKKKKFHFNSMSYPVASAALKITKRDSYRPCPHGSYCIVFLSSFFDIMLRFEYVSLFSCTENRKRKILLI